MRIRFICNSGRQRTEAAIYNAVFVCGKIIHTLLDMNNLASK